jgi:phospholipase C
VTVTNLYGGASASRLLGAGEGFRTRWSLSSSFGGYDLTIQAGTDAGFLRRLAGHVENGRASASDPAIGDARWAARNRAVTKR